MLENVHMDCTRVCQLLHWQITLNLSWEFFFSPLIPKFPKNSKERVSHILDMCHRVVCDVWSTFRIGRLTFRGCSCYFWTKAGSLLISTSVAKNKKNKHFMHLNHGRLEKHQLLIIKMMSSHVQTFIRVFHSLVGLTTGQPSVLPGG